MTDFLIESTFETNRQTLELFAVIGSGMDIFGGGERRGA